MGWEESVGACSSPDLRKETQPLPVELPHGPPEFSLGGPGDDERVVHPQAGDAARREVVEHVQGDGGLGPHQPDAHVAAEVVGDRGVTPADQWDQLAEPEAGLTAGSVELPGIVEGLAPL